MISYDITGFVREETNMKNYNSKRAIFSLIIVLTLIISIFATETIDVRAASKKTVRVATEKQLKSALKNSKVGTIILRTQTYNTITISSKKAKKKNIIIDAPHATIINKTRFKSIEILDAIKYVESVSGNTITAEYGTGFIVDEGKSVKKLTFNILSSEYTVRKNGKIKSLCLNNEGSISTYDKKSRCLTLESTSSDMVYNYETNDETEVFYPISYTAVLDECGRTLEYTYSTLNNDETCKLEYDENGNCIKKECYNNETGILEETYYYNYDSSNNLIEEELKHIYAPYNYHQENIYDDKNNMVKTVYIFDSNKDETEYVYEYDEKNRITKSSNTKIFYEGDRLSSIKTWKCYYQYDKNGMLLSEIDDYDEGFSYNYTYAYDNKGNITYYAYVNDNKGMKVSYEYKYTYDKYGIKTHEYTQSDGEWIEVGPGGRC